MAEMREVGIGIRIRICEMPDLTVVSRVRLDLIHSHFRGSV